MIHISLMLESRDLPWFTQISQEANTTSSWQPLGLAGRVHLPGATATMDGYWQCGQCGMIFTDPEDGVLGSAVTAACCSYISWKLGWERNATSTLMVVHGYGWIWLDIIGCSLLLKFFRAVPIWRYNMPYSMNQRMQSECGTRIRKVPPQGP